MTDEKKLTDDELEHAQGAGPGISSQKTPGRGQATVGGGSAESTAAGSGTGNEGAPERPAYPDPETPK